MHLHTMLAGRVTHVRDAVRCGLTRAAREMNDEFGAALYPPLAGHAQACPRCLGDERRARLVAVGLARTAGEWESAPEGFVGVVTDRVARNEPRDAAEGFRAVGAQATTEEGMVVRRAAGEHARRAAMAGAGAVAAAGLAVAARRRLGAVS